MKKETVLRVSDVTMQFGGVVAVNNLNLEVRKEFYENNMEWNN